MTHASLERKLLSAQAAKTELENKLRQKEVYIEQLEGDRRFLAEREQAEREEKEKERKANTEDKVGVRWAMRVHVSVYLAPPHLCVLDKCRGRSEVFARRCFHAQ